MVVFGESKFASPVATGSIPIVPFCSVGRLEFVRSHVAVLVQVVPCQKRFDPMDHPVFVNSPRFLGRDDAVSGGFASRDRIQVRQEPVLKIGCHLSRSRDKLSPTHGAVRVRVQSRKGEAPASVAPGLLIVWLDGAVCIGIEPLEHVVQPFFGLSLMNGERFVRAVDSVA